MLQFLPKLLTRTRIINNTMRYYNTNNIAATTMLYLMPSLSWGLLSSHHGYSNSNTLQYKNTIMKQQQQHRFFSVLKAINQEDDDDENESLSMIATTITTADDDSTASIKSFASDYHNPVMCRECIDALLKIELTDDTISKKKERRMKKNEKY